MSERVVVTGGRDFFDGGCVHVAFAPIHHAASGPVEAVAQGGADGADRMARGWAQMHHVPCVTYAADWQTHGRKAGPLRNRAMLDDFKPTLVLAFPGGRGTADCVKAARERGIRVIEVQP